MNINKLMSLFIILALISCHTTKKKTAVSKEVEIGCIDQVMKTDKALGYERNHDSEKMSLSESIAKYVDGLAELNYSGCPAKFKDAFIRHRQAWVAMIEITNHYTHLRGEMHDLFDKIGAGKHAQEFSTRLEAIWSTWAEIEQEVHTAKN